MATITMQQVTKKFGEAYAVKPMDLTINDGEFVALLGPSGCGKTTSLRMISGLEAVTSGNIFFDSRDVTWVHPSERDIAFVFQFFALYSHMTARENIAFPLQAAGMSRSEIDQRVQDVAEMLRISRLLDARPGRLSGGDQQRIALARALVRQPAAFLMDEPLGALDAEFRESMRGEIKQLHISQNATTVYVTHDQVEAMAMGDRIVVMSAAEIQQVGTPHEVYHDPSNLFVARFIGSPGMNLLGGIYEDGMIHFPGGSHYDVPTDWHSGLSAVVDRGSSIILGFRPEAVTISDDGSFGAEVYASDLHGGHTMLHLDIGENTIVHARAGRETRYAIGERCQFDLAPDMVRFFDPRSERSINKNGANR